MEPRAHSPTPPKHAQLVKRLAALPGVHVLGEATGGYERAVAEVFHAAALPPSVINPARVRQFARAAGELAKTGPIAAAMLCFLRLCGFFGSLVR